LSQYCSSDYEHIAPILPSPNDQCCNNIVVTWASASSPAANIGSILAFDYIAIVGNQYGPNIDVLAAKRIGSMITYEPEFPLRGSEATSLNNTEQRESFRAKRVLSA